MVIVDGNGHSEVQILNESVSISHSATLRIGINPTIIFLLWANFRADWVLGMAPV